MNRLIKLIERAYALGVAATHGQASQELAEEVASETAEFLALYCNDTGSFDVECIDQELAALVKKLQAL